MKTIYLHIGRGKTGTTFIQDYLSQKRAELLKQGLHYIHADDRGLGSGHQQFAKSFIVNPPSYMLPAHNPEFVRQQIADEIRTSQSDHFLLSSENLPLASLTDLDMFIRELPGSFSVKVLLFVRSQDELAESEYNQLVKLKRETCSFGHYAHEELEDCDYFSLASKWERQFGEGNIICNIFNSTKFDLIKEFLSLIPQVRSGLISEYQPKSTEAENRSLGVRALAAIRILNDIELTNRETLYKEIISGCASKDLPALFFDSKSAEKFRSRFADSNRAFTKHFLGYESDDLNGRRYTNEDRDEIIRLIDDLRICRR